MRNKTCVRRDYVVGFPSISCLLLDWLEKKKKLLFGAGSENLRDVRVVCAVVFERSE